MKLCPKCKEYKELECFAKNSSKTDGRQTCCRACKKQHDAAYYKANSVEHKKRVRKYRDDSVVFVREIKAKSSCMYCEEDDPCCLDFHHIDQETKEECVSTAMFAWSKQRLQSEIDKCKIMCSNCHRKLHAGRQLVEKMLW